jgi:hypothetical protein
LVDSLAHGAEGCSVLGSHVAERGQLGIVTQLPASDLLPQDIGDLQVGGRWVVRVDVPGSVASLVVTVSRDEAERFGAVLIAAGLAREPVTGPEHYRVVVLPACDLCGATEGMSRAQRMVDAGVRSDHHAYMVVPPGRAMRKTGLGTPGGIDTDPPGVRPAQGGSSGCEPTEGPAPPPESTIERRCEAGQNTHMTEWRYGRLILIDHGERTEVREYRRFFTRYTEEVLVHDWTMDWHGPENSSVEQQTGTDTMYVDVLNLWAQAGWEVVTARHSEDGRYEYLLRRPIQDDGYDE